MFKDEILDKKFDLNVSIKVDIEALRRSFYQYFQEKKCTK
jgi:hypothetical protein